MVYLLNMFLTITIGLIFATMLFLKINKKHNRYNYNKIAKANFIIWIITLFMYPQNGFLFRLLCLIGFFTTIATITSKITMDMDIYKRTIN